MTTHHILCISLYLSLVVQTYKKYCRDIVEAKAAHGVELKRCSALQTQQVSLPSRILYSQMKVKKLQENCDFLHQMRAYAQSQMTDDEKRMLWMYDWKRFLWLSKKECTAIIRMLDEMSLLLALFILSTIRISLSTTTWRLRLVSSVALVIISLTNFFLLSSCSCHLKHSKIVKKRSNFVVCQDSLLAKLLTI